MNGGEECRDACVTTVTWCSLSYIARTTRKPIILMPAVRTLDDVGALLRRDSVFSAALARLNGKRIHSSGEVIRKVFPELRVLQDGPAKTTLIRKYDKAMRTLINELDRCRLSYAIMNSASKFMMQFTFGAHTEFKRGESLVVLPYGISAGEVEADAKTLDRRKAEVLAKITTLGSSSTTRAVNPDLLFSAFIGTGVGAASSIASGAADAALLANAKDLAWWQIALAVLSIIIMASGLILGL